MRKFTKQFYRAFMQTIAMVLLSAVAFAQTAVSGKVTDSKDGAPVAGATVTVKGAKVATKTAADGTFTISVPANATLIITSVGFGSTEVSVAGKSSLDVSLVQSNQQLNEVVVVGYGTQRKKDLTGSIVKIGSDKIANVPAPSFESALAGKAAGVQISTNNGLAGSGAVIRIRGISTVSTQGDPLFVIDGLPINMEGGILGGPTRNTVAQDRNPLANINPNDIESVEILKDASAAGIYGSRGANGVILITTKKGKGKGKLNFSTRVGVSTPSLKPKFVNKDTWLAMRQEAWENDGNTGVQQNLPGGLTLAQAQATPETDWWKLATQKGFSQEYNLSYSKGTKNYSAFMSGVYSKQQSYVKDNDYTRLGLTGNFDYKAIKNLTLSVRGALNSGVNNLINNAWNGGLGLSMSTALPYYPVYNADGSYFRADGPTTWEFGGSGNNLVAQRDISKFRNVDKRYMLGGSASYNVTKKITVATVAGYEKSSGLFNSYNRFVTTNLIKATLKDTGNAKYDLSNYSSFNWGATVNYVTQISKNIKFTGLLGAEYQEQKTENKNFVVDTTTSPLYDGGKNGKFDNLQSATPFKTSFNKLYQSYFARTNFNFFEGKYNIQASIRRDVSSVFKENNKVAYFPTISGAWTISDENFMQKQKIFNFLKLKAGWGLTGNDRIPWDAGYSRYDTSRSVGNNYGNNATIYQTSLGNPDLKWETSNNLDLGIEFGILKNKISGELGIYKKTTRDILLEVPQSISNGVGDKQWQNQGSLLNQGIEFTLNTTNIKKGDFTWTTSFNIAHNYNEILEIGSLQPDAIAGGTNETRIIPGNAVGTIYTVRFYGVDPADGSAIYLDRNGNQTKILNVDSRTGDKVPVANVNPDFTGGLTNNFKYKNFELNTLFTFTKGGSIWDNSGKRSMNFITDWQIYQFMQGNYWRKPGDIAKYPRLTLSNQGGITNAWDNNTSLQVYDASFTRLKELSLAYYLPGKFLSKYKMSSAKVYFAGYNLLLFTKYPVGDPDGGRDGEDNGARNQSPNANFLNPPQARSFNIGINVTF
jgi:TonB-dependent starch-binding outer membrane protein SusC